MAALPLRKVGLRQKVGETDVPVNRTLPGREIETLRAACAGAGKRS